MKRKIAALLLALALCLSLGTTALAYDKDEAAAQADALNQLGLFQGTGQGYQLDIAPTRMHALIMLIRLSGQEANALYGGEYAHPFTDAPTWEGADAYLGYAYENGLAQGVSDDRFNPNEPASAQMFVTFALRALGYTDGEDGSVYDNWESLAASAGILPEGVDTENFLRGDAVLVSYAALEAKMQGSEQTLAEKLMSEYVFGGLSYAAARRAAGETVSLDSPLFMLLSAIYDGVEGTVSPDSLMTTEITEENVVHFFGTDTLAFTEGIAAEPMISSIAHSVCLLRLADGADVEQAKKAIAENVNPRKWICVGVDPENVRVENIGNLILLVMDNGAPDALVSNFLSLGSAK